MKFTFDREDLQPLVAEIVAETLRQVEADSAELGGRVAFPEREAAGKLSMSYEQLRDERYDGRIKASVGRKGRILYSKADLLEYLTTRRWKPKER